MFVSGCIAFGASHLCISNKAKALPPNRNTVLYRKTTNEHVTRSTGRHNPTKIRLTVEPSSSWYERKNHKAVNIPIQTGIKIILNSRRDVCQVRCAHTHTVQRISLISQVTDNTCVCALWLYRGFNKARAVSVGALKWNDPKWIYSALQNIWNLISRAPKHWRDCLFNESILKKKWCTL